MISHYGYADGSGEYYIVISSDKCDGCGICVKKCPQGALEMVIELVDLEDKTVAAVVEKHRTKIRYTCSSCGPETGLTPCVVSCPAKAVGVVWKLSEGPSAELSF